MCSNNNKSSNINWIWPRPRWLLNTHQWHHSRQGHVEKLCQPILEVRSNECTCCCNTGTINACCTSLYRVCFSLMVSVCVCGSVCWMCFSFFMHFFCCWYLLGCYLKSVLFFFFVSVFVILFFFFLFGLMRSILFWRRISIFSRAAIHLCFLQNFSMPPVFVFCVSITCCCIHTNVCLFTHQCCT